MLGLIIKHSDIVTYVTVSHQILHILVHLSTIHKVHFNSNYLSKPYCVNHMKILVSEKCIASIITDEAEQ